MKPAKLGRSANTFSCLAEDNGFRSRYIRALVQGAGTPPGSAPRDLSAIPKVIVQFWHDSNEVPSDVLECLSSWKALEDQGFRQCLFDDVQGKLFIKKYFGSRYAAAYDLCYHPAMRCDYFRLCYIWKCGGFYVDADDVYQGADCRFLCNDDALKVQPLCYDAAAGAMVSTGLFMKERRDSAAWIFYINNNPIISPPHHPIVEIALERATRILLKSIKPPEIQSTTGPGNLTVSLVTNAIASQIAGRTHDFRVLDSWESISVSRWPLSYRNDERNWRLIELERN